MFDDVDLGYQTNHVFNMFLTRKFSVKFFNFTIFLYNIIGELKNSKHGVNTISSWLLKKIKDILSYPLSELLNNSFLQGEFPISLRQLVMWPYLKAEIKV